MSAGTDRIATAFRRARDEQRSALVAYVLAGHPAPGTLATLVLATARAGADVVEVGIPYSDPLADGATIRAAARTALAQGMTVDGAVAELAEARSALDAAGLEVPLVPMGYAAPLLRHGTDALVERLARAGADGVIIPDQPPEEDVELAAACAGAGLARIHLVTPVTDDARMREVAAASSGFLYCVATTGTTGARAGLADGIGELAGRARAASELPVAVGFGVSRPEHAAALAPHADGIVVGSALLDAINAAPDAPADAVARLVAQLADAAAATPAGA